MKLPHLLVLSVSLLLSSTVYANNYVEIVSPSDYAQMGGHASHTKKILSKGYVESTQNYAHELMNTVNSKRKPEGLHMLLKSTDLTFTYESVAPIISGQSVGFAHAGTLKNGRWTGVGEYINSEVLGACKLRVLDMQANKGKIYLSEDQVEYTVNKLPTTKYAYGSEATAYSYQVNWVRGEKSYDLECASRKFDSEQLSKMIGEAKKIDDFQ